jgi:hypothetical protein
MVSVSDIAMPSVWFVLTPFVSRTSIVSLDGEIVLSTEINT